MVVCNTEADLKNKELGWAGAAMAASAYARPRQYSLQGFLDRFRELAAEKDKMDKAARKEEAASQAEAEAVAGERRDGVEEEMVVEGA